MGHPRVAGVLKGAAAQPSGTYLFVGSAGVGKRNAARVFAAALVCPAACGRCETCRRVLEGIHPDVAILQPEGYTFPVEVLRATAHAAAQSPIEADHRVFVIQEADRIPERSQNALLKALEEPGQSVIWVLLATTLQPFLPTVLSRCQIVDFPPIGEEGVLALLQDRYGADPQRARQLLRMAGGELSFASRLAADPQAARSRELAVSLAASTEPTVAGVLAAADEVKDLATQVRQALERQQAQELARLERSAAREGQAAWRKRLAERNKRSLRRAETEAQVEFLSWVAAACRDLAAVASGTPAAGLAFGDHAGLLELAAGQRSLRFWVDMIEHCLQTQTALRNNASPPLAIESLLLRLVL